GLAGDRGDRGGDRRRPDPADLPDRAARERRRGLARRRALRRLEAQQFVGVLRVIDVHRSLAQQEQLVELVRDRELDALDLELVRVLARIRIRKWDRTRERVRGYPFAA